MAVVAGVTFVQDICPEYLAQNFVGTTYCIAVLWIYDTLHMFFQCLVPFLYAHALCNVLPVSLPLCELCRHMLSQGGHLIKYLMVCYVQPLNVHI